MITPQERQQFLEGGVVTVDTPLTSAQISAADTALKRLLPFQVTGGTPSTLSSRHDL